MSKPSLLTFWGKTGTGGVYHPALFHMLDVGNVAYVLLDSEGQWRLRHILARALNSRDTRNLIDWLPFFVALHDIGKISAPFQGQASNPQTRAERERLISAGLDFGRTYGQSYPHAQVSAVFAQNELPKLLPGIAPLLVHTLRDAVGGHHGRFVAPSAFLAASEYIEEEEPDVWKVARSDVYAELRKLLAPALNDHLPVPTHFSAAAMALTGFMILCDWLGSDRAHFEITPPMSIAEYLLLSREWARKAVKDNGFASVRPIAVDSSFSALFPEISSPRPLQNAIDALSQETLAGPSLFIIEAPTGEGKTEAALALAHRLAAHGTSDELYFGLPTTATSNQMFDRVHRYLNRVVGQGTPIKLIHGQAFLVEDDLLLRLLDDTHEKGEASSTVAASVWFAPRKRSLLAPFGVGTVDQIELTVLNARYAMLRLFGLAGKVVIIDEIHAYDTYMSTVLEHALAWLASLGSSVILLSATLPARRHAALAEAFQRSLGREESDKSSSLPYPCLAAYTLGGTTLLTPSAAQPARQLRMVLTGDETITAQAERLIALIREGGAVCRLCNTVATAQKLFQEVEALLERYEITNVWHTIIHSRFPQEERNAREAEITARFGPDSARTSAERAIIIGTQVLEQSLDLDFDVMVSDHAPTDLLLQRAGRLHRHVRRRPAAHMDPVLYIHLPIDADGFPCFGANAVVYDAFILWKSWLVLMTRQDGESILLSLPNDYRPMIEETYDDAVDVAPADTVLAQHLRAAFVHYRRDEEAAEKNARQRLVPYPSSTEGLTERRDITFEEDEEGGANGWGIARTRDGVERLTVVPLYRHGVAFSIDPAGLEVIGPECDRLRQLRLLARSIPVSNEILVARIRAAQAHTPRWFRDAPLLKYVALLLLEGTTARYGNITVTLTPKLGLEIERKGGT